MKSQPVAQLDFGNLTDYLRSASALLDEALEEILPRREPMEFLYGPAADYPSRGGKRFRPSLLMLCAALPGGDPALALPSALALELFQNFALVHDDIEDDSLYRRGAPTLHRLHGIPLAINAGDMLFGLAHEALLANVSLLGPERACEVHRLFAQVFRRTFEGQALDIGWCHKNYFPSREEYRGMIGLKTGWYSGRGPCRIGGMIGGAEPGLLTLLGDFGEKVGIGFQMRDDLLNLTSDSAGAAPAIQSGGYGKERGGDIAEGKRTLIMIETLERVPAADGERLKALLLKPAPETQPGERDWAIGLAESSGAIEEVRGQCTRLALEAQQLTEALPTSPQRELLRDIALFLTADRET